MYNLITFLLFCLWKHQKIYPQSKVRYFSKIEEIFPYWPDGRPNGLNHSNNRIDVLKCGDRLTVHKTGIREIFSISIVFVLKRGKLRRDKKLQGMKVLGRCLKFLLLHLSLFLLFLPHLHTSQSALFISQNHRIICMST